MATTPRGCDGALERAALGLAEEEVPKAVAENRHRLPLWLANLFVFALLFMAVTGYFFWQSHQARNRFLANVQENAVLVAEIIQLSARGSVLSKKAVEEILETFLGNTARFIGYLDKVEPFTSEELTAFAAEAGLAGIRIHKEGKKGYRRPPGMAAAARPRLRANFRTRICRKKTTLPFFFAHGRVGRLRDGGNHR